MGQNSPPFPPIRFDGVYCSILLEAKCKVIVNNYMFIYRIVEIAEGETYFICTLEY